MTERWRPVWWAPRYEVSDLGRVRSWRLVGRKTGRSTKPKILVQTLDRYGYPRVAIRVDGVRKRPPVHRLVLEAFVSTRPPEKECRHKDGNPQNNRLRNLQWSTHVENVSDRRRHGTEVTGHRNGRSRLRIIDVRAIKARLRLPKEERPSYSRLAREYDVAKSTIQDIADGRTWKGVV